MDLGVSRSSTVESLYLVQKKEVNMDKLLIKALEQLLEMNEIALKAIKENQELIKVLLEETSPEDITSLYAYFEDEEG